MLITIKVLRSLFYFPKATKAFSTYPSQQKCVLYILTTMNRPEVSFSIHSKALWSIPIFQSDLVQISLSQPQSYCYALYPNFYYWTSLAILDTRFHLQRSMESSDVDVYLDTPWLQIHQLTILLDETTIAPYWFGFDSQYFFSSLQKIDHPSP